MAMFTRSGSVSKAVGRADVNADMTALAALARKQMNIDIAYIGEFSVIRRQAGAEPRLEAGHDETIMPFPAAAAARGGRHGPVTLEDDEPYGSFCCFTRHTNKRAKEVETHSMAVFARGVPEQVQTAMRAAARKRQLRQQIGALLEAKALNMSYQPVFRLWKNEMVGLECRIEFPPGQDGRPDTWLADAYETGLGPQLEVTAINMALSYLWQIPEGVDLWITASVGLVMSGMLGAVLEQVPMDRIVLEITEHEPVADYEAFLMMLIPLRRRGMRLAVDDAGAGHSTLRHILKLRPDIIKLDRSLTQNLERDSYKMALTAALISFAVQTSVGVVATGIESLAEMNRLRDLGVHEGQGDYLGRFGTMDEALAYCSGWQTGSAAE